MGISLTEATQQLIEDRMKAEGFATADQLVRFALGSMHEIGPAAIEKLGAAELQRTYPNLHEKIAIGLEQMRAGETSDGEAFFAELDRDGF